MFDDGVRHNKVDKFEILATSHKQVCCIAVDDFIAGHDSVVAELAF